MSTGKIDLTIAICCYNGERYLPATLDALALQEGENRATWEILLVDNASTDSTPIIFQAFAEAHSALQCRMVREEVPGQSAARKRAIEQSLGEWLCFVDDDNILARDYIQVGLAFAHSAPKAGAFGGKSIAKPMRKVPSHFAGFASSLAIWDGGQHRCNIGLSRKFTAGMFVRRTAATALIGEVWMMPGRSPESKFGGEDAELCIKLVNSGWEIWYLPELCFEHVVPESRMRLSYLLDLRSRQGGEDLMLRLAYEAGERLHLSLALQLCRAASRFIAHLVLGLISFNNMSRWTQFSRACFQTGRFRFARLALGRAQEFVARSRPAPAGGGGSIRGNTNPEPEKNIRVLRQIG